MLQAKDTDPVHRLSIGRMSELEAEPSRFLPKNKAPLEEGLCS
jgi:hypothetical protein